MYPSRSELTGHEWQLLRALEDRIRSGEKIKLTDEEFEEVARGCALAGFSLEIEGVSAQNSEALESTILSVRKEIRRGSIALSKTIGEANRLAEKGDIEGAASVFRHFIEQESVEYYRDLANEQLRVLVFPRFG